MGGILVLGGGMCGLATAMMLARDGHDVTVLERDTQAVPASVDDALQAWERPGVPQFRMVHYMHALFRHVLQSELPDMVDALIAAGARRYDPLERMIPPTIEDRVPRDGDDRYWTVTGRRPMLETVFGQAAANEPRVKILRGTKVQELVCGQEAVPGVPHVIGVKTVAGDVLHADVVIDAMGRASKLPEWLQQVGGRPPYEEAEDVGYTYYGREFRGPEVPAQFGPPLSPHGSISCLTLPGDNDTWMVVLFLASGDQPLKELRHEEKWSRVVRALPLKAHWIDGEALTGVESMSGVLDRYRRYVVDGKPVVTGIVPVADAMMCTNPSLGRGISLGLWHVRELRKLLHSANGDPAALTAEWDAVTDATITPWYRAQVDMDRRRMAEIHASRNGEELPPLADDDVMGQMQKVFFTALEHDADVFRGFMEIMSCLATPEELMMRPGMLEKAMAAAQGREPTLLPGPTRQELLELIA